MNNENRFGISELADAAGVSVRTVRYYITEGLLPPPVTAGAKSYYTDGHRDRLIVIGRLKDAYLPLREIRRQLAEMDEASIHDMAEAAIAVHELVDSDINHSGLPHSSISNSLDHISAPGFIEGYEDIRPSARDRTRRPKDSASEYISRVLKRAPERTPPALSPPARPLPAPASPAVGEDRPGAYGSTSEPATWRRIVINDDAELLVREETYVRRKDKVAWLVDWAKKVLG